VFLNLYKETKKNEGLRQQKIEEKKYTHTLNYYKVVSAKNENDEKESFLSYRNQEEKYLIHDVKCIIKKIII
jgi:hypothetical protein